MRTPTISLALSLALATTPVLAQDGLLSRINPFRQSTAESDADLPREEMEADELFDPTQPAIEVSDEAPDDAEDGLTPPKFSLPKPTLPTLPKWEVPKLSLPSFKRNASTGPVQPSAWERFNKRTRSFFAKTRATLMPWTISESQEKLRATPPRRRIGSRPQRGKSTLMDNLFKSEDKPREIESVNDYLELPRPTY